MCQLRCVVVVVVVVVVVIVIIAHFIDQQHVEWFEELNTLMNPNRNYKNYRRVLVDCQRFAKS
jgi:type II secretory pathway component PulK